MGGKAKLALALLAAALLAASLAACGSGDSTSTSSASGAGKAEPDDSGSGKSGGGSDEPSTEFLVPGGDNSIQTYGKEAGAGDRDAASAVLEAYMSARGEGDWAKACAELAGAAVEPLERIVAASSGCPATLETIAKRLKPGAWANTMTGPIAALRREGEHAFALYHGSGGTDYFMQMSTAGGVWKVAAVEPTALP